MKKLAAILILGIGLSLNLASQSGTPRYGASGDKNADNTGRVLTYNMTLTTFTSTLKVTPNAYETVVSTTSLTGACTINATVTACHGGDKLILLLQADTLTAGRVVTLGGNFIYKASGSTITVAANKSASAYFIFDPKKLKFIEISRTLQ